MPNVFKISALLEKNNTYDFFESCKKYQLGFENCIFQNMRRIEFNQVYEYVVFKGVEMFFKCCKPIEEVDEKVAFEAVFMGLVNFGMVADDLVDHGHSCFSTQASIVKFLRSHFSERRGEVHGWYNITKMVNVANHEHLSSVEFACWIGVEAAMNTVCSGDLEIYAQAIYKTLRFLQQLDWSCDIVRPKKKFRSY
jgi:hypothetical protein